MANYIEDLVQNIYTKCDMKGLDKLNQGLKDAIWYSGELEKNLRDAQRAEKNSYDMHARAMNAQKHYYLSRKQEARLLGIETRERIKNEALRQKYDDAAIGRLHKRNILMRVGLKLLGAYFSIKTLQNIIRTGTEIQLIQRAIVGLTGSTQDWEFLDQVAYKFGLSLKTVASGYKNFYSSAKMAGFDPKQIQSMFSDMLLGARSIGANNQQIGGALLALEQMMSKGRVSMEELRRQLGNALPGAFEIGAKAMGVTTQEFNEMVKAGISAQEFVPKFIKTFKEQYKNGWKDVEQTVSVAQGRLRESWEKFTFEFLHGEAGKAVAQGLNQLAAMMRSPEFMQLIKLLGKIFTIIVKILSYAIKNLGIVLILLGAGGLTGVITRNIKLLTLLGRILKIIFAGQVIKGINLLSKALLGLSIPVMILYAKILAIIAALLLFEDIYTGLFHKEKESFTKDYLHDINNPSDKDLVRDETTGYYDLKNKGKKIRRTRKDWDRQQRILESTQSDNPIIYDPKLGRPSTFSMPSRPQIIPTNGTDNQGVILEKEENNDNNISMGNVTFNIYGATDPIAVGKAVDERLSMLLTGQMEGVVK